MPVDLFAPGVAQALVLLAARVSGLLVVAPAFSARTVPVRVRTALMLALTLLLAPAAVRALGAGAAAVTITPAAFAGELLVGFAMGLGAALLVGAVETAGDLIATTIGLSGATLLDPTSGAASPMFAQFAQLFALTVLLSLDGHLVMLDAVAESARALPVGGALDLPRGMAAMVAGGGALFVLGLRFAAPVIAATLIGNTALAVLTRVAPSLNVLTVAFPLQAGLGLVATTAALAMIATWMTGWSGHYGDALARVFTALAP